MKKSVPVITILSMIFALCACSESSVDTSRIEALESEVKALRHTVDSRDSVVKDELVRLRQSLENIEALIEGGAVLEPRAEKNEDIPATSEEALDEKARSFVNDSLARLMDLTGQLLDDMERELDERLTEKEEAPIHGDEI
ncbi:hypothetical protein GO013_01560 [Pseudodesulfovibrio sp. JC047]|uniref:hypothetical protein n=1 Tax=Pseudodesulfovibrio sp. JC047 TaxID=2683199 RepID=UPI0013D21D11|nr:hypothetical protein [Pseudodesulfovibrio sp. JC047]NDV18104.1 hypothetical protein [Pseudodesulfovibrio sp. JC047]